MDGCSHHLLAATCFTADSRGTDFEQVIVFDRS